MRVYAAQDPLERFWAKVEPEPNSGCWLWVGGCNREGYGLINLGRRGLGVMLAHRFSFERFRGPLPIWPAGALDHRCRVRCCVNPEHLQVVTQAENWRRGDSPNALAKRTGACKRGHVATPANIQVRPNGYRYCRVCERINLQRRTANG
jgi:hypothetical protein